MISQQLTYWHFNLLWKFCTQNCAGGRSAELTVCQYKKNLQLFLSENGHKPKLRNSVKIYWINKIYFSRWCTLSAWKKKSVMDGYWKWRIFFLENYITKSIIWDVKKIWMPSQTFQLHWSIQNLNFSLITKKSQTLADYSIIEGARVKPITQIVVKCY